MKKEKTSLEKSHSGFSNFKLTLLSLITLVSFVLLFVLASLLSYLDDKLVISIFVIDFIVLILCLLLFRKFKR